MPANTKYSVKFQCSNSISRPTAGSGLPSPPPTVFRHPFPAIASTSHGPYCFSPALDPALLAIITMTPFWQDSGGDAVSSGGVYGGLVQSTCERVVRPSNRIMGLKSRTSSAWQQHPRRSPPYSLAPPRRSDPAPKP